MDSQEATNQNMSVKTKPLISPMKSRDWSKVLPPEYVSNKDLKKSNDKPILMKTTEENPKKTTEENPKKTTEENPKKTTEEEPKKTKEEEPNEEDSKIKETLTNEAKKLNKIIWKGQIEGVTQIQTSEIAMKKPNNFTIPNEDEGNKKSSSTDWNDLCNSFFATAMPDVMNNSAKPSEDESSEPMKWDDIPNQTYAYTPKIFPMPNVIGFITLSFLERGKPYDFTITTLTHYISDRCDSQDRWLQKLSFYIQCLDITTLYVAGTKQKALIGRHIPNIRIEFIYNSFCLPEKKKCPVCRRFRCSKFKATNILRLNFHRFPFTIPCTDYC